MWLGHTPPKHRKTLGSWNRTQWWHVGRVSYRKRLGVCSVLFNHKELWSVFKGLGRCEAGRLATAKSNQGPQFLGRVFVLPNWGVLAMPFEPSRHLSRHSSSSLSRYSPNVSMRVSFGWRPELGAWNEVKLYNHWVWNGFSSLQSRC